MDYDVIIIGGGAAGLSAAVFLGRRQSAVRRTHMMRPMRILLLEKQPRVGKKLLATGNGTCNLTNIHASAEHYHGAVGVAQAALAAFSPEQAIAFFTSVGVDCRVRPDGKVYPYSEQAGAVLDALRLEAAAHGVTVLCEHPAENLTAVSGGWQVSAGGENFTAPQVLVTVGGAAAPALGGSADGYRLLTAHGCRKTPLFPSIVQIRTDTAFVRAVKGIRTDAVVTLMRGNKPVAEQTGEVLFTEYGLSGPAVMQISRAAADWERHKDGEMTAVLDLLPDMPADQLTRRIAERAALPGRTLEDLLTGLLHKRVGQTVLRAAEILPLTRPVSDLTEEEIRRLAAVIKGWRLTVTGTQGFGGAQVTAGGIDGDEVNPRTMMLRRLPGVYAAGEVLDVDGDCGGFNLQFAWSSSYVAAVAIADHLSYKE